MSANFRPAAGWGDHSLLLSLHFAHVRFNGLSEQQHDSILQAYSEFLVNTNTTSNSIPIISECFAYRLSHSLNIPSDKLAVNGQYTPLKIRESDGIKLTGINFNARIQLKPNSSRSMLGVAKEHELAQPNVVESFLRVLAAHLALERKGVILHSAGLVFDHRAYIFCGRSGAGKTTLTRKAFAAGASVLSDDINLLLPGTKDTYLAHAIPFTGEFGRALTQNQSRKTHPLRCLVLLEQGDKLEASNTTNSQAVARLLTGCPFVNMDASESEKLFDVVTELARHVPVIRLQTRRDDRIDSIMQAVQRKIKSG
jgi:hypothetical protein